MVADRRYFVAPLLLLASVGSAGAAKDEDVASLTKLVSKQSARIQALESQLGQLGRRCKGQSRAKGCSAAEDEDPEPELQPFRAAERRRHAARRQQLLETLFEVEAGERLVALAVTSSIVDKGVPRYVAGAGESGTIYLYHSNGTLALAHPPEDATAATLTSIIAGPKEDPFIAVGSAAGEVLLYNLTMPRVRKNAGGPTETRLTLAMRAAAVLDVHGRAIPVLTIDTYMRGRRAMSAPPPPPPRARLRRASHPKCVPSMSRCVPQPAISRLGRRAHAVVGPRAPPGTHTQASHPPLIARRGAHASTASAAHCVSLAAYSVSRSLGGRRIGHPPPTISQWD